MKAKWNWIDGLILLGVLAAVVVAVLFFGGQNQQKGQAEEKVIEAVVELKDQNEAFTKVPKVGDAATVGVKEKIEMVVTAVEALPAKTTGYDRLSGRVFESERPGNYDMRITLQGIGVEDAQTVSINGNPIRVGAEAVVKSKNWAGDGVFLSLKTFAK